MVRWFKWCGRALVLSATSSVLLFGQHYGGHFGGGGAAYGTSFGMSPIAPFRMPPSIALSPPSFGKNSANSYSGFSPYYGHYYYGHNGSHYYSGRRNYVGIYPFFVPSYPFPFDSGLYPYDSGAAADEGAPPPPPPEGPSPEESQLGAQVAQLSEQINDLQAHLGQGGPIPGAAPVPQAEEQMPAQPPVTVVLNDGKTMTVRSYAVMGHTFWDLSSQPVHKIDVSKIDLAASTQASEANGAEFPKLSGKSK